MSAVGDDVTARRVAAAEASRGASDEAIYGAVMRLSAELRLAGAALDFGAGVGNLARRLRESAAFDSVTACDLMEAPSEVAPGVRWISADLNEPLPVSAGQFDVVFAIEVIEHLENPRATAREWHRLLRAGGWIVASTPNNESWRSILALVMRGHYVAFGESSYPAHITPLVRKDLERILVEAGFEQPRFVFTNVGGIPKLPHVPWQRISPRLFRGLRYSDNVVAIARKP